MASSSGRVAFVQGADVLAPGLSRTEDMLIQGLTSQYGFAIRRLRFPTFRYRMLMPYMYGPLPLITMLQRPSLVHIGSSWYAHLVPVLPVHSIVTCHDLIELDAFVGDGPHLGPHRRFHARAVLRGLRRARFVACVSRATAQRVAAHVPDIEDRLRVIYNGVSPAFSRDSLSISIDREPASEDPYLLYVGSEQDRKNLDRLVSAVSVAMRALAQVRFVKVGGHQTAAGRAHFLAALRREGLESRTTILEHVSDEELAALYRGAAATVLVSLEEGFGFPALEAMACGCPAIVSDRGSLREITGGCAIIVDPLDVRAIAGAIEGLLTNPALHRRLSVEGVARAAHFTWDRAVRGYAELYDEILRGKIEDRDASESTRR